VIEGFTCSGSLKSQAAGRLLRAKPPAGWQKLAGDQVTSILLLPTEATVKRGVQGALAPAKCGTGDFFPRNVMKRRFSFDFSV